jgi:hypothetical protein
MGEAVRAGWAEGHALKGLLAVKEGHRRSRDLPEIVADREIDRYQPAITDTHRRDMLTGACYRVSRRSMGCPIGIQISEASRRLPFDNHRRTQSTLRES